jgi:methylated-DNA-[protein]-cysteine S-methyltransferase
VTLKPQNTQIMVFGGIRRFCVERRGAMQLFRVILGTPIGEMLALASEEGLCALEFTTVRGRPRGKERPSRLNARLARWFPPHEIVDRETPTLRRTRAWLDAYFDGATAEVGDLPLDMRGAPFEKRVWKALTQIAPGETTSYGAIAAALDSPGASRAVGAANGANPVSIIVPCHRVVGASGSLTGYGGGLDRKTWLLEHERRWRHQPQALLF